ncbi:P-loop containing nucleoside triphosphate hydrolase protein [Mycena galericulata]|nr:P-loop containing nucleoside triphosphate hydrolase protein [Mycena galericulata]
MEPVFIVAMGVSGTGKSTLGAALAAALRMPYVDGDDLHPRANVDKMAAGEPLTDADRGPWLRAIRETAERIVGEEKMQQSQGEAERAPGVVIACSALKRVYRDVLRGVGSTSPIVLRTCFVFIDGTRDVLMERMLQRTGHFMKASMLDSQLDTLEDPRDEEGVVVVSVQDSTETQVQTAVQALFP